MATQSPHHRHGRSLGVLAVALIGSGCALFLAGFPDDITPFVEGWLPALLLLALLPLHGAMSLIGPHPRRSR